MDEEKIKQAFLRVRNDMMILEEENSQVRKELIEIKQILEDLKQKNSYPQHNLGASTVRQIKPTNIVNSTDNSTFPQEIEGLKNQNLNISIGNEGVTTDRHTHTLTDNSTHNFNKNLEKNLETDIQEATNILDSLDNLKKEIRRKFKKVTPREMAVFSIIYQLEEQNLNSSNYKEISLRLGISESSIRDYVQKMINKGIPIKKQKIDNKKILLSISPELKRIASLSTIIQLREL